MLKKNVLVLVSYTASLLKVIVNGHRNQQQSYTENQQNCFFF